MSLTSCPQKRGNSPNDDSIGSVLAGFVREVWISSGLPPQQRQMVLIACLDALGRRGTSRQALGHFVQSLDQFLRLAPLALAEIKAQIHAWMRATYRT